MASNSVRKCLKKNHSFYLDISSFQDFSLRSVLNAGRALKPTGFIKKPECLFQGKTFRPVSWVWVNPLLIPQALSPTHCQQCWVAVHNAPGTKQCHHVMLRCCSHGRTCRLWGRVCLVPSTPKTSMLWVLPKASWCISSARAPCLFLPFSKELLSASFFNLFKVEEKRSS